MTIDRCKGLFPHTFDGKNCKACQAAIRQNTKFPVIEKSVLDRVVRFLRRLGTDWKVC